MKHCMYIIPQAEPFSMFNRGTLSNVGFIEAKKRGPFDCYIFHDVDMLVEDDRGMYTCSTSPRHLGAYIQKYRYRYTNQGRRHHIGAGGSCTLHLFQISVFLLS